MKPLKGVQLVKVQPGQSRSGRAGSEWCLSLGDRREEASTARKQAVRKSAPTSFVIATPTPLAWRKAASSQPRTRGCSGVAGVPARGMLSRGVPANPGELPTSLEVGAVPPNPNRTWSRGKRGRPTGSEQTLDEEYLRSRETGDRRNGSVSSRTSPYYQ
jgi:hypothetical protein